MRKLIELGETIRLYTGYEDLETGEAMDPALLNCTVTKPDASVAVITYPATNFVREALGEYYIRILGDQTGTWRYRIYAEINANDRDVRDGKFDVESLP